MAEKSLIRAMASSMASAGPESTAAAAAHQTAARYQHLSAADVGGEGGLSGLGLRCWCQSISGGGRTAVILQAGRT